MTATQHTAAAQADMPFDCSGSIHAIRRQQRLYRATIFRPTSWTRRIMIGGEFLAMARRTIEETDAAYAKQNALPSIQAARPTIGGYVSLAAGNLWATLSEYHKRLPEVEMHT